MTFTKSALAFAPPRSRCFSSVNFWDFNAMTKPPPTPDHFRRMAALSHAVAQLHFKMCALWEEVDEMAINEACGETFRSCLTMSIDELACQWLGAQNEWAALAAFAEAESE